MFQSVVSLSYLSDVKLNDSVLFCCPHALTDCNQCIRIREKTPEVSPTLIIYTVSVAPTIRYEMLF